MMISILSFRAIAVLLCSCYLAFALPTCTSQQRLAGAEQVVYSYNLVGVGQSAQAFRQVPFGPDCHIYITPDGSVPVPTAVDGFTCYSFAVETRQAFSKVTGTYDDFTNGTAVIHTNVTLGALHEVTVPVTFHGEVYLDYDATCMITAVRAFAKIPSEVFGQPVDTPDLDISK